MSVLKGLYPQYNVIQLTRYAYYNKKNGIIVYITHVISYNICKVRGRGIIQGGDGEH